MAENTVKKTTAKRSVSVGGVINIKATFNNTIISISDMEGNIITWASGGTAGFKGSRKGTSFASQVAAQSAAKKAYDLGMRNVEIYVKGPGSGRDAALRALKSAGLGITMIADVTPMPHNGVRPKKKRRV